MVLLTHTKSSSLQTVLFVLLPFVWYVYFHKTAKGYLKWLGLFRVKEIPVKAIIFVFFFSFILLTLPQICYFYQGLFNNNMPKSDWSIRPFLEIVTMSVQTSLSEEIFFRGFLGKRISYTLGWKKGTGIQASLYGAFNLVPMCRYGFVPSAVVFLLTSMVGFSLGWLSLRKEEGSILYGWIVHTVVNIVSVLTILVILF